MPVREQMQRRTECFLDALHKINLKVNDKKIVGDSRNTFEFYDSARPEQPIRKGQIFIPLDDQLTSVLPGSSLGPDLLIKELRFQDRPSQDLLGVYQYTDRSYDPAKLAFQTNENFTGGGNFDLSVFHGATNESALKISGLAYELLKPNINEQKKLELKAAYQSEVAGLMTPVLNKESAADITIVEDCLASGETMVETLGYLLTKTKLGRIDGPKIRIDLMVATTQGILMLHKFAADNNLNLELNVGYVACGLSEGKAIEGSRAREHANYIVYPDDLPEETLAKLQTQEWYQNGSRQVVGDMGDAFGRLGKVNEKLCLWEKFRKDNHGLPPGSQEEVQDEGITDYDPNQPTLIGLRNGGYMMVALWKYIQSQKRAEERSHVQIITFDAKRVWGRIKGSEDQEQYGVLLNNIPECLLEKLDNDTFQ